MHTRLPEATREAQMEYWGIPPGHVGGRRDDVDSLRNGTTPLRATRHGRTARDRLGYTDSHVVNRRSGGHTGGVTSHRGVVHPDEYVDGQALRDSVLGRLGFTLDEVRSVYRQGPLSEIARDLRARLDARLLEIDEAGGSMPELGRALGMKIRKDGRCRTLENALARARAARSTLARATYDRAARGLPPDEPEPEIHWAPPHT